MAVERGDFGPVRVTAGRHQGRIGYYDDDDGDDGRAIVYLEALFVGPYELIPHLDLVRAEESPELERFVREHPELAKQTGVRPRRSS